LAIGDVEVASAVDGHPVGVIEASEGSTVAVVAPSASVSTRLELSVMEVI
jgi:hypothetical protein